MYFCTVHRIDETVNFCMSGTAATEHVTCDAGLEALRVRYLSKIDGESSMDR